MHVLMLSDHESSGGAAIAASRLAEGLCRAGHRVTRLVTHADDRDHAWSTRLLSSSHSLASRAIRYVLPARGRNSWNRHTVQRQVDEALEALNPDVINLHNLHGAAPLGWSPELLRVCSRHACSVWTLHDMWSFTGRCAYSYDCCKYLSGCDATCPTQTEYPALPPDRIAAAWSQRKRLLALYPAVAAVAPSHWLAREAQAGLWAGHRIEVIPYGLPLNVYRPLDRALAREALGIESSGPVLLVAAQSISERRKGGSLLVQALRFTARRPLTMLTLGSGHSPIDDDGIRLHTLGYIDHERTKVLAYSAADLFVHPAPVDNLPNVVMESIACGTPVVGFPVGGMIDLVRPGQTGWLAKEVSPTALAQALQPALNDLENGVDLRNSCRAIAEAEYSDNLQAIRYLDLFRSLCKT